MLGEFGNNKPTLLLSGVSPSSAVSAVCVRLHPAWLSWSRAGSFVTPQTNKEARDGNQNKLLVSTSCWCIASFRAAVDGAVIRQAL